MLVFETAKEVQRYRSELNSRQASLGFVPTMGALHQAHMALAHRAKAENDAVMVSIFVNPTQFNNTEDLERYPRRNKADLALLKKEGVHAAYLPSTEEMYQGMVQSETINLTGLDRGMEGEYRPGHFPGVATIIRRFFAQIKPDRAYFGEKDYQQLRVVEHLTEQLQLGVQVVGCPTERSPEGLAMSSRNYRLSNQGLKEALDIVKNIRWAQQHWQELSPQALKAAITERFASSSLDLEYVEIARPDTMQPLGSWEGVPGARIFLAAFCEGVRLIDNDKLF
jgi:pantoate--beta-alanine ligase